MTVVRALLCSDESLVHEGRYYRYRSLRLHSRLDPELRPRVFLAGSSPAGQAVAAAVADVAITHPEPVEQFAETFLGRAREDLRIGIRIGLVARPTDEEAGEAARTGFPKIASRGSRPPCARSRSPIGSSASPVSPPKKAYMTRCIGPEPSVPTKEICRYS